MDIIDRRERKTENKYMWTLNVYKSMYVSTVYNNKVCDGGGGDGCGQVLANSMTPVYSFKQCQDTDPPKQTINSEVLCVPCHSLGGAIHSSHAICYLLPMSGQHHQHTLHKIMI